MTQFLQYWSPVIGPLITALGVLIAAVSLLRGLERGRRELAVNLIYNWTKDLDWVSDRAINLAKTLKSDVIEQIRNKEGVSIPTVHFDCVTSVLRGGFPEGNLPDKPSNSATTFQITPEHSAFIYFLWVRWLNRLEGTLAGWLQGTANIYLMQREFGPLVKSELKVLSIVRDGLPIISAFYKEVIETDEVRRYQPLSIFQRFPFSRRTPMDR
jgi:hypothetical protein